MSTVVWTGAGIAGCRCSLHSGQDDRQGSDRRLHRRSPSSVAKNFLLSNEQTLQRKLKEAVLVQRIESAYSKGPDP